MEKKKRLVLNLRLYFSKTIACQAAERNTEEGFRGSSTQLITRATSEDRNGSTIP